MKINLEVPETHRKQIKEAIVYETLISANTEMSETEGEEYIQLYIKHSFEVLQDWLTREIAKRVNQTDQGFFGRWLTKITLPSLVYVEYAKFVKMLATELYFELSKVPESELRAMMSKPANTLSDALIWAASDTLTANGLPELGYE